MKKNYVISNVTTYDHDEMLWFTKVGTDEKGMPLHFICAGKTVKESRERAEHLVEILKVLPQ